MVPLSALWLPIVLSAVVVFVVSSLIHMASPWHKNDYPRVPDEDRLRAAVGPLAIPQGEYMVPRPKSHAEMRSPEFLERRKQGPNLILTVLPNPSWPMGKHLGLWFAYLVVVSIFAAYVAGSALPPAAEYLDVFCFAGTTAFLGFVVALWQMPIWYGRSWSTTIKATVDGLIYSVLAAGLFGWLWPK